MWWRHRWDGTLSTQQQQLSGPASSILPANPSHIRFHPLHFLLCHVQSCMHGTQQQQPQPYRLADLASTTFSPASSAASGIGSRSRSNDGSISEVAGIDSSGLVVAKTPGYLKTKRISTNGNRMFRLPRLITWTLSGTRLDPTQKRQQRNTNVHVTVQENTE